MDIFNKISCRQSAIPSISLFGIISRDIREYFKVPIPPGHMLQVVLDNAIKKYIRGVLKIKTEALFTKIEMKNEC